MAADPPMTRTAAAGPDTDGEVIDYHRSSSPGTSAASIPKVTNLRKKLDYGDPVLPRCVAFYDDTRVFRKKFYTASGICGLSLHDWKSKEHHNGLDEMTTAYLDKEGNGALFWPQDEKSPNFNKYSYRANRAR